MHEERNAEPRCAALKSKGGRCKNAALPGRLFCRSHDPDVPTSPKWAAVARAAEEHPEIFGRGSKE